MQSHLDRAPFELLEGLRIRTPSEQIDYIREFILEQISRSSEREIAADRDRAWKRVKLLESRLDEIRRIVGG